MIDLLRLILTTIVDHPDDIRIDESTEADRTIYTVTANSEDYGKIIGKNGRIIKAIRDLVKTAAIKDDRYVDITLADEQPPAAV